MTQGSNYAKLLDRLTGTLTAQADKPEETPESTLKALCFFAAGTPVSVQKAAHEIVPVLDERMWNAVAALVELRVSGTPLAHITGRQQFLGMEVHTGPDALIPRVETEILGRAALSIARSVADARGAVTVLDVCTGSGNVALAIAMHEARAHVFGADISPGAVAIARTNMREFGLGGRVEFSESDLFAAFESEEYYGTMDLVTCNPPYISSAKVDNMDPEISQHEPRLAFDGGSLGITILSRLIKEAPKFLIPRGHLCFEVGLGQGSAIEQRLKRDHAYCSIRSYADAAGQVRALSAQRA